MGDCMTFPEKYEDFIEQYEIRDGLALYTKGELLIPSFRVKQMMEHYAAHEPIVKLVKPDPEYPYTTIDLPCTRYRAIFWDDQYIGVYDAGKSERNAYKIEDPPRVDEKDARITSLEKANEDQAAKLREAEQMIKKETMRAEKAEAARDKAVTGVKHVSKVLCLVCKSAYYECKEKRESGECLRKIFTDTMSVKTDAQD